MEAQWNAGLVAAIVLGIALILGSADEVAAEGSKAATDGCAFKAATALVADDAADCCATEAANDGSGACIWASCAGNHGEGRSDNEC